jgi:glycosyltransferase involved in cell wall biosynthesis
MALSAVKTSHIIYADVDFWPSTRLHSILSDISTRESFASDPKLAAVVPTFQLHQRCQDNNKYCHKKYIQMMPEEKVGLMKLIETGAASIFDPANVALHGSMKYIPWKDQEDGTFVDLPCVRSDRYEPFLALRYCRELPPFQEGFSADYGQSTVSIVCCVRISERIMPIPHVMLLLLNHRRAQWAMQLQRVGYKFLHVGGAFLMHYPHVGANTAHDANNNVGNSDAGILKDDDSEVNIINIKPTRRLLQTPEIKMPRPDDALFLDFEQWLDVVVEDESRTPLCEQVLNRGQYLSAKPESKEGEEYKKNKENNPDGKDNLGLVSATEMNSSKLSAEVCLEKTRAVLNEPHPSPVDGNPLVCIVVTTYNVEEYVERSLQAISQQTYPTFHVIVVDDSSTDSTTDKINKVAQSDHRFCLVDLKHNTAGGTGQPSNIGLDSCSEDADYILIADGDDWMERDALELLLLDARRFHSDIVFSDFDTFSQQDYSHGCTGTELNGSRLDFFNRTSIEHFCDKKPTELWPFVFINSYDREHFQELPTEHLFNFITHPAVVRVSPVPWRKLYSRSFIESVGLRFPEGDYFFEDNSFHWMTTFYARRITMVDKVLFHHMRNREVSFFICIILYCW